LIGPANLGKRGDKRGSSSQGVGLLVGGGGELLLCMHPDEARYCCERMQGTCDMRGFSFSGSLLMTHREYTLHIIRCTQRTAYTYTPCNTVYTVCRAFIERVYTRFWPILHLGGEVG
jgi:hypothetical protein